MFHRFSHQWFRRTQYIPSIGLFYKNVGRFPQRENTKYAETFTKSIRKYNPPSYFCGQNQSNISNNAQNSFNNSIFESQVYNHPSSKGRIILLPVSNTTPITIQLKLLLFQLSNVSLPLSFYIGVFIRRNNLSIIQTFKWESQTILKW